MRALILDCDGVTAVDRIGHGFLLGIGAANRKFKRFVWTACNYMAGPGGGQSVCGAVHAQGSPGA